MKEHLVRQIIVNPRSLSDLTPLISILPVLYPLLKNFGGVQVSRYISTCRILLEV